MGRFAFGARNLRLPSLLVRTAQESRRTVFALRRSGRADFTPQFHQGLVQPAAAATRKQGLGHCPEKPLPLGRARVAVVAEQPAQEPQRIGLEDRLPGVEGDREDGPRRVAANARQAADDRRVAGKAAAVLGHDDPRRPMELPRAAVIAQPFPQTQYLVLIGPRSASIVGNRPRKRSK